MHHRSNARVTSANASDQPFAPYARLAFVAFVGSMWPVCALAQQPPQNEEEIVVTAPLEGSRIESLQGTTVLNREDVVDTLNGGLGNSLDALPGVSTTFYGVGASRPIIRGLGDDRVRVLENGIGAIDAASASPDHAVTADGLDASRIEVLRGAAALAYGGNAIGGVINVLDESIPTHRTADPFSADALGSHEGVNQGREGALGVTADAGSVVFHLSAAARETDDYDIPGFANADATGAYGTAPNSWTSFRAYAAGASLVRDWGYAGLAVKRTTDDYGLPPEAPGELGGHIELEQTREEARGDLRVGWGPFNRLDFGVQHADYEHTEFEGDGAPGTTFTNEGWEGRVEAHHRSDELQGAIGAQGSDNDFAAIGEEGFITPTNTRDFGVFAIERWDTGGWGLEGGLRAEQRTVDNEGGGERDFTSTSASAGAFIRPAANWFLGATLARTERAPTATELFANGPHLATFSYELGNPDNDTETALSIEGSARYTTDAFTFELNLYHIDFSDYTALVDFEPGLGTPIRPSSLTKISCSIAIRFWGRSVPMAKRCLYFSSCSGTRRLMAERYPRPRACLRQAASPGGQLALLTWFARNSTPAATFRAFRRAPPRSVLKPKTRSGEGVSNLSMSPSRTASPRLKRPPTAISWSMRVWLGVRSAATARSRFDWMGAISPTKRRACTPHSSRMSFRCRAAAPA